MAGFFGKFYLFVAAAKASTGTLDLLWLVALAIVMSAVSLYYYLKVLRYVFVSAPEQPDATPTSTLNRPQSVAIDVLALLVLGFGIAPDLIIKFLSEYALLSGF